MDGFDLVEKCFILSAQLFLLCLMIILVFGMLAGARFAIAKIANLIVG